MKAIDSSVIKNAFRNLTKAKIFTLKQLMHEIGCLDKSARRILKKHQAYKSFNQNARFYTLPQNLKLNQDGLWFYRDAGFSSHGNLSQTVVALVKSSKAGLGFRDIKDKLKMTNHSIQSMLTSIAELKIEKINGRLFYFFNDMNIYQRQRVERLLLIQETFTLRKPFSEIEALWILIERLTHPRKSLQQLCDKLKSKIGSVEWQQVDRYFKKRGIDIKKNPPSPW